VLKVGAEYWDVRVVQPGFFPGAHSPVQIYRFTFADARDLDAQSATPV